MELRLSRLTQNLASLVEEVKFSWECYILQLLNGYLLKLQNIEIFFCTLCYM